MVSVHSTRLPKLTRPRLHSPVQRDRLFRLLDKRITRPIVWVSGPPGAGKSTLVASYLEARKLPGAWFRVDGGDRDAATFFHYLKHLASQIAGRRRVELPDLTTDYMADVAGFARRFFRSFFGLFRTQAVVVFDNCHDAGAAGLYDLLREACAELPDALAMVMISRESVPEALARWRTSGAMMEICAQELRLTSAEARAIAATAQQPGLDAVALNNQVQGWVAGLVLLLSQPSHSSAPTPVVFAHERLFEYFAGEVLSRMAPTTRRVLLATSLLPAFTPAMAQRLSGEAQAGKLLDWLFRQHYFVERKFEGEVTYRYHDLFRGFLRTRLDETTDDEERSRLHRAAGEVLRDLGEPDAAVRLLRQAGEWDLYSGIVLDEARSLMQAGRWRTLLDWFDGVPAPLLSERPWLEFWKAVASGFVDTLGARVDLERCYASYLEDEIMQVTKLTAAFVTSFALATGASAQQPVKVKGTYVAKPIAYDVPALKGIADIPYFAGAAEYVVRGGGIYDGVRGVSSGTTDLHGDVWLQQGIASHEKDGSKYVNRWRGHCVSGKTGGSKMLMCNGDWYTLPGATGIFSGIVASGTYTGTVNSEGYFEAEWSAMYMKQ